MVREEKDQGEGMSDANILIRVSYSFPALFGSSITGTVCDRRITKSQGRNDVFGERTVV
jgi:hypothetical protein